MTTRFVHANGIELRVRDTGEGPPLLLLHGLTGAGEDWRHVFDLDALARDHRVIAPDLRGHGGSSGFERPFTHRECARDVLAMLDALGIERCRAMGLSLGGNTLLHVATMQPARVEAMVIVSATPRFPEQARTLMRAAAAALAESHDDLCFTAQDLATIRARTMVVQGDRDPLYPVSLSVEMRDAIPGAALWILPESGHGPIFGAHRDEVARRALAFLA